MARGSWQQTAHLCCVIHNFNRADKTPAASPGDYMDPMIALFHPEPKAEAPKLKGKAAIDMLGAVFGKRP